MVRGIKEINIPINRAEGDLEVNVEVEEGVVGEAWSVGTLYRGFEAMMQGRGALDGLVMTPRVCGICSITHLNAAAEALDRIAGVTPPDNACRLRNLALMAETVQSDVRQSVLMFMADFANSGAYGEHSLAAEARARFQPLEGRLAVEVIRESKRLVQVIAIIGGQWPHTSFMVPGGVTAIPDVAKLLQSRIIVEGFRSWYESAILGCSIERWQEIQSLADLDAWLAESERHREATVGFFLRFCREAGLDRFGRGPNRYLSYGNLPLPEETTVQGSDGRLLPAGYAVATTVLPFDPQQISEDVSHSWYEQGGGPRHPYVGATKPYASGQSGRLYSWVKAPRYGGEVVETGPLAEKVVAGDPLFVSLVENGGPNVMVRQLARLVRPAALLAPMARWLEETASHAGDSFYRSVSGIPDGSGAGLLQAARGALGHWVTVQDEKIVSYQIITPTAWNGSPRDEKGRRGAWEEALIGTPLPDVDNPVQAGHVIRSFDPCLVCAVHCLTRGGGGSGRRRPR